MGNHDLSPAGDQVAVSFPNAEGNLDIWVLQVARHTWRRLTTDVARDIHPLWTPDGRRIVFASNREGISNALYWVPADGSGEPEALTKTTDGNEGATSWSPDGRLVFYETGARGYDLFTVIPGEEPVPLPQTEFDERSPALSPDGAWLAYASDETGEEQVYVMPFSGQGGQTVSTTGGRSPRWSANGRELFYRNGTEMMVVDVTLGSGQLDLGSPRRLFDEGYVLEGARSGNHNYDVTGDGQRFLMHQVTSSENEAQAAQPARIIVVKDWFEELKRLVPTQ